MTETVVHVETIEQWKSVLDVWFAQGYDWLFSGQEYSEKNFEYGGSRQLALNIWGDDEITCFLNNDYTGDNLIEYADFMEQQEKTIAKETYYVTQEQLDLIEELKTKLKPLSALLTGFSGGWRNLDKVHIDLQKQVLRYIGGDTSVEFKAKEHLYRLWRIDSDGDEIYMKFTPTGNPDLTMDKDLAFTAPLEEIKKHKTVSWEIEKAD